MGAPKTQLDVPGSDAYLSRREKRRKELGTVGRGPRDQKEGADMYRENWEIANQIADEEVRRNFTAMDAAKAIRKAK